MLPPRAGAQLGNYALVRAIGSGGMGVVYEAHHESLGRHVAIKVLHALAPGSAKEAVLRARFLREGRAAALVRHPHVVDVFDFGVHEGMPFLVMELVEGENLGERLARETSLSLGDALEVLLPVVSAVAELHSAGIIHRDLKPANILLGRGRSGELCPKVVDFGVSRADDGSPSITESGVVVGTYRYMPPEQAQDARLTTEHADQYALAAILYECLTGHPAFPGETRHAGGALLDEPLVPASSRNPELPEALDSVLQRALSREPSDRFACVEEFGAALLAFAAPATVTRWRGEFLPPPSSSTTATIPPVSSPGRARRSSSGRRALVWSLPIVVGVGIVALSLASRRYEGRSTSAPRVADVPAPPGLTAVAENSSGAVVSSLESPAPSASIALKPPAENAPVIGAGSARPRSIPAAVSGKGKAAARTASAPARARSDDENGQDNGAPLLDPR